MTARLVAATATWIVMVGRLLPAHAQAPGVPGPAASPAPGTGSERPSSEHPPPPARTDVVEIIVVGRAADYQRLIAPIGARTPLGVPLFWSRLDRFNPLAELLRAEPSAPAVVLRCWIDLTDLRRAALYFAGRGGQRFLVRELALSGSLDEVDQQSLAQVLEISIEALLENQDIGLTRAQAREVLTRSQPVETESSRAPPPPSRRWQAGAAVFYAVEQVASALPLGQGPGVMGSIATTVSSHSSPSDARDARDAQRARARVGLWIAGHYRLAATARSSEIGVRLQAATARAGLEAGWGRFAVRIGGGADWVRVTPLPGTGAMPVMLAPPHWSMNWVATAALAARLPIDRASSRLDRVTLSLVLVLESVPTATQYEVQDANASRVAFALRRVRPGLALELGF